MSGLYNHCSGCGSDHHDFTACLSQKLTQSISFGATNAFLVHYSKGAVAYCSAKGKLNDCRVVPIEEVF